MNYDVDMWLSYTPKDQSAEAEFRKRFPLSLEEAWASLSMTASNLSDLANQLNGQILSDCKGYINSDTGVDATEVTAFSAAAWKGSGTHNTPTEVDVDVTQPSSAPWTFDSDSKTYQMTAQCNF